MGGYAGTGRHGDTIDLSSEGETEIRTPSRWHRTSRLPDGTPIGRLGAYWYVLDRDDCAISDGYHELYLGEDGDYRGRRNARTERIGRWIASDRTTR